MKTTTNARRAGLVRALVTGAAILAGSISLALAQPMSGGPGMHGGGPGMYGGGPGMYGGGPGMYGGGRGMHAGMGMGGPGMGGMHMGPGGGRMVGPMLDAAGATPEQRTKVQEIMNIARTDMQSQQQAGRALREEMARLVTAPQLDASAVEAARQRMLAHHDGVSRRMTQAMLDASAVLTPEQRQKAATYMASRRDMMERHRRERETLAPKVGA